MPSKFALFGLLVLSSYFLVSCGEPGCTVELADNYDPAATYDDESCIFTEKQIGFYTNAPGAGEIHVELSESQMQYTSDYGAYYTTGFQRASADFEFIESMKNPSCSRGSILFGRYENAPHYYDAHNKHGYVWSGVVVPQDGNCTLVELRHDPEWYGEVVLFTNRIFSGSYSFLADPTGPYSNDRKVLAGFSSMYELGTVDCQDENFGLHLVTKAGNNEVAIYDQWGDSLMSIPVIVPSQGCVTINLSNYL